MAGHDDEVPARFCIPITLDEGEAIITNLLDADGAETSDPRDAAVAVAQLLSGEDVGCWVTFTVEPEDFIRMRMH
jgi:hypothetical protein